MLSLGSQIFAQLPFGAKIAVLLRLRDVPKLHSHSVGGEKRENIGTYPLIPSIFIINTQESFCNGRVMFKRMLRNKEQWEEIYRANETPWDAKSPDPFLVSLIRAKTITPCKAIDIGCGFGNETIFLAKNGFKVTGIDISKGAISEARKRADKAGAICEFLTSNILDLDIQGVFDFALDRACFHFLDPEERDEYVKKLSKLLRPGSLFLLIVSSNKETFKGPYQFSRKGIVDIFKKDFIIENIQLSTLETHAEKPKPYICMLRKT